MVSLAAVLLLLSSASFAGDKREEDRARACDEVLQEILDIPENIPPDLLNKAECVVVIPGTKKFAIGVGGSFGRGALSCRTGSNYTGPWSAPALYALEGANIGFQLGGEETDFVLLVMNPKGVGAWDTYGTPEGVPFRKLCRTSLRSCPPGFLCSALAPTVEHRIPRQLAGMDGQVLHR